MLNKNGWDKRFSPTKAFAHLWLWGIVAGAFFVRTVQFESLNVVNVEQIFLRPSLSHWLGTDSMGRDFLLRILQGAGSSLIISICAISISLFFALIYGSVAAWFGNKVDIILMAALDVWMSLPSAVLAALVGLLLSNWSQSLLVVSLIIGSTHWGRLARLVRGEVLRLREKNYIKASEAIGASQGILLKDHLIPHLKSVLLVYLIYQLPNYILTESFLSFIGLGVQPPETSWGILLQEGWRSLQVYPHVVFFPSMFLFLTILALNIIFSKSFEDPRSSESLRV